MEEEEDEVMEEEEDEVMEEVVLMVLVLMVDPMSQVLLDWKSSIVGLVGQNVRTIPREDMDGLLLEEDWVPENSFRSFTFNNTNFLIV